MSNDVAKRPFFVFVSLTMFLFCTGCATQVLDYALAKQAGAQFADNEGRDGRPCRQFQGSPMDPFFSGVRPNTSIVFYMSCIGPIGDKADPEAFKSFNLKNGWKIKQVNITSDRKGPSSDWQWTIHPVNGSIDPHMKIHMWANGGNEVRLEIGVDIEGPAFTNPYQ